MLLEQGGGNHLIINVGGSLRPLQSHNLMQYQHKNSHTAAYGRSKKRHPTRELEHRPPSNAGKDCGVCLVKKLRTIQFYEADFNCYNQFIFGKEAINFLNSINYMPEELFSQKGSTSKGAKFDKTLMADLSRQVR
jgi:hypothetical protein